jgi:hypothetical protein
MAAERKQRCDDFSPVPLPDMVISRSGVAVRLLGVNTNVKIDPHVNDEPDSRTSRNPFGVQDAPDPDGSDVDDFAAQVHLSGSADDPNARAWRSSLGDEQHGSIEGAWSSRWNGGADPAIAGDTKEAWKQGNAELQVVGDRVYLLFDWGNGSRQALIDARRDGPERLIGRYVNLSDPAITRPWVGLIVDNRRIDGCWTSGRLDFQR